MRPMGLTNMTATTITDQVGQEKIVVLALDHRGDLWQRVYHNGWEAWEKVR